MKKFTTILMFVLIASMATAQTMYTFEGESTAKVYKNCKTKVTGSGPLMNMLFKRYVTNNPDANFVGTYTTRTVTKKGKTRVEASYNNSVTIEIEEEDGKIKQTVYYPYIKKGYTFYRDKYLDEQNDKMEEMRKGEIEHLSENLTILGYKCDVYKVKYVGQTDTLGTVTDLTTHNEYAISTDPSLPDTDKEVLPGIKGFPLKYCTSRDALGSNKQHKINIDTYYSISQETTSITPREVDDSEFEIPSDIKIVGALSMMKTIYANKSYMEKKGLWKELPADEDKIYDNLEDDWDF